MTTKIETETRVKELLSTRDAYGETLVKLGKENRNIVVLDSDLSASTRTSLFAQEFPDRFFNCGIAEANMIGIAAGLAALGKIPFASSFAIFATGRPWEQIRQSVCYPRMNVKLVASHGGITVGEDGGSHISIEDIGLMRIIPYMTVVVPADAFETERAVEAAASFVGPIFIRLSREKFPVCFDEGCTFRIGKAPRLREGSDLTIISAGLMVSRSLDAAEILSREGIQARVINCSTIKPLDEKEILDAARETGAIVTAEEHSIIGGLGSAISEFLMEREPVPLVRIGIRDVFGVSGKPAQLLEHFGLTGGHIAKAGQELLLRKKSFLRVAPSP
jgi:transketolase